MSGAYPHPKFANPPPICIFSLSFTYILKRCGMFKKGSSVMLNQPIEGKKDRFEQGLKGTVVEEFDLPHGKSYRVQFVDGRVARFPEQLMKEAIDVIG